jgi:hypothetical protein
MSRLPGPKARAVPSDQSGHSTGTEAMLPI